ncbi:flavin reductase, partial [Rhodococcus sp. WS4]
MLTSAIDQAHYRSVMGNLPTGVVALSGITADAEYPCGLV